MGFRVQGLGLPHWPFSMVFQWTLGGRRVKSELTFGGRPFSAPLLRHSLGGGVWGGWLRIPAKGRADSRYRREAARLLPTPTASVCPPMGGWGRGCRTRVLSPGSRGGVARGLRPYRARRSPGILRSGRSGRQPTYHVVGLTPGTGERQRGCSKRQRLVTALEEKDVLLHSTRGS